MVLSCTLLPSPEPANTDDVLVSVIDDLSAAGVEVTTTRVVDHTLRSGSSTDLRAQDGWRAVLDRLSRSDIVVLATPTWRGRSTWVAHLVVREMRSLVVRAPPGGSRSSDRPAVGVLLTSGGTEDGADSELVTRLAELDLALPGLRPWSREQRGAMVAELVAAAMRLPSAQVTDPASSDRQTTPDRRSPIT